MYKILGEAAGKSSNDFERWYICGKQIQGASSNGLNIYALQDEIDPKRGVLNLGGRVPPGCIVKPGCKGAILQ